MYVHISVCLLLGTLEIGQFVSDLKPQNSRNIDDVDAEEGAISLKGPLESPGKKIGSFGWLDFFLIPFIPRDQ